MTGSPRRHRLLLAGIATAAAALPLAPTVHAEPAGPDVPSDIEVEDGHHVFLVGHAVGVQIYACNQVGNSHAWGFVGPRAELYGDNGKLVATHFRGPTWQARDGSTVVARFDGGVTVDPTAIPWLRLAATSSAPGGDGDRLTATTFIQRTATTGGLMPAATECTAATAGTTAEVPYTADYHFWKRTGR